MSLQERKTENVRTHTYVSLYISQYIYTWTQNGKQKKKIKKNKVTANCSFSQKCNILEQIL